MVFELSKSYSQVQSPTNLSDFILLIVTILKVQILLTYN